MQGESAGGMPELRVNTAELRLGGKGLEDAANNIPPPPERFTSEGTDALSKALTQLTQDKEASLIEGLPKVKAESLKTAQDIGVAADRYETTDQEIADTIMKRIAEFDARFHPDSSAGATGGPGGQFGNLVSGGSGGGSPSGSGAPAGAASGIVSTPANASASAGPSQPTGQDPLQMLQQMGQVPMQMMQQAGQLPQGIMQGAQSGAQQISQMAGEAGKKGDSEKAPSAEPDDNAQQVPAKGTPTAPGHGAGDGGSSAERAPVAAPSGDEESAKAPAAPKHEAAPVNPVPNRVPTDSSILL